MTARLALVVVLLVGCREDGVTPQRQVVGGDMERGERAIVARGCGSCHVIPGVAAATGRVGPPLTDLADRIYIAGRLRNEPVALVGWIRDPQSSHPGSAMPNLGIGEAEARDIATYLYTLTSSRLGPPHLIPIRFLPGH